VSHIAGEPEDIHGLESGEDDVCLDFGGRLKWKPEMRNERKREERMRETK